MPRYLAVSERVGIRRPRESDREEFCRLALASRELHRPWITAPTTAEEYAAYLRRGRSREREAFLICELDGGGLVGWVNINGIQRRSFQSGALGYGAFAPSAGKGLFGEGLGLVVRYAFDRLGLHRLEANLQPENHRSRAVVARLGFKQEGYSPEYLFIDGAWRDHERWALIA
ncbi:MAG: GNAT family N-acetyltransferase [Mycobacteriales bacterium]